SCTPSLVSFSDPPPTVLYPLSLHDALPISRRGPPHAVGHAPRADRDAATGPGRLRRGHRRARRPGARAARGRPAHDPAPDRPPRSEEHTSELQSRENLVCRLLLEKKKKTNL